MYKVAVKAVLTLIIRARPKIHSYLSIITILFFIVYASKSWNWPNGLLSSFAELIDRVAIAIVGVDVLAFIDFHVSSLSMIKRGVKDIERTVAEGPIIRFESGETAYKYLKHILESRRKEIVEIHSTAIQQRGTLLDAYRDYFAFLYRQFYSDKTENRPALKSIVSFDPLSDLTAESKFLFEICFKSLFGKRGRNPITGDGGIEFWFVPADLFVPFVNFTLIKFDDGSCESVWGWYVDQSDRLGENDADLNKLLEEEVFARSHSVTMYQGFKSIFDLVRYNWEKPMGEMASPKIQIGFGTTETTIQQHLQTIVKKASSLVDKMKEDATHA